MEKELLEKIKQEINEKYKDKEKITKIIKEIDELKNNKYVKRYLEIAKYDNTINREFITEPQEKIKKDIISRNSKLCRTTNKIYFCFGNYPGIKKTNGEYYISNHPGYGDVELVTLYRNIENYQDSYIIPTNECEEFENNHYVIPYIIGKDNLLRYNIIQQEFFDDALNNNQEEATSKILKKYIKKR